MTTDSAGNSADGSAAAVPASDYPVRLTVDYPEGPRNRLTALIRPIMVIPILVVLMLLSGSTGGGKGEYRDGQWRGPDQRFDRGGWWMPGYGGMDGWGYGWMRGYAGMPAGMPSA